jgi:hypothetical protein
MPLQQHLAASIARLMRESDRRREARRLRRNELARLRYHRIRRENRDRVARGELLFMVPRPPRPRQRLRDPPQGGPSFNAVNWALVVAYYQGLVAAGH